MRTYFLLALVAVATATPTLPKDGLTFAKEDCDAKKEHLRAALTVHLNETLSIIFDSGYKDLLQQRLPDVIVNRFCSASPSIKNVISDAATITDCLDPEVLHTRNDLVNSINLFIDQTCNNEGAVLKSFVDDGSLECFISRFDIIEENCSNLTSNADDSGADDSAADDSAESKEECQNFLQIKTCVLDILDDCTTVSSTTFLKSMFNSYIDPLCSKYAEEE